MRKLLSYFFITFFFFITPAISLLRTTVSQPVHAQGLVNYIFGINGEKGKAFDAALNFADINNEGYTWSILDTSYKLIITYILGKVCLLNTTDCDTTKSKSSLLDKQSLVYNSDHLIAALYANPSASTYAFIQDMGQSLGFIPKTAYAQGVGFSGLSPLLPLWKAFRNVAYLLLAVFMIVIGFFIMFRKKIDPKTVMTVQNALPNVVVTLLLITFSYAIVGLLIDVMYLLIAISISILQPVSKNVITSDTMNMFMAGSFVGPLQMLWSGGLEGALTGFLALFNLQLPQSASSAAPQEFQGLLSFFVSNIANPKATLPTFIIVFIYACAFLFAVIRLLVVLIKAHVQIIMSLIISPFQLLLGVFPGSHAFEGWIKNLIANIAVFPITAIMLLIGSIIVRYGYGGGARLWGPPMLNPGGNEGMLGIIGLGVLFAIPSVCGALKEAMKAKSAIGGGAGGAVGFATQAGQQLIMFKMQKDYQDKMLSSANKTSGAQERSLKDEGKRAGA